MRIENLEGSRRELNILEEKKIIFEFLKTLSQIKEKIKFENENIFGFYMFFNFFRFLYLWKYLQFNKSQIQIH